MPLFMYFFLIGWFVLKKYENNQTDSRVDDMSGTERTCRLRTEMFNPEPSCCDMLTITPLCSPVYVLHNHNNNNNNRNKYFWCSVIYYLNLRKQTRINTRNEYKLSDTEHVPERLVKSHVDNILDYWWTDILILIHTILILPCCNSVIPAIIMT